MDGIWLSMQGKDRPKKTGKREMKVATCYRGWEKTGKDRRETVGKVAYAGYDEPRDFHRRFQAQTAQFYDMDETEVKILGGDGAKWIRSTDDDVIEQLDPFHRSRALVRWMPDKADRAKAFEFIRDKDVCGLLRYICERKNAAATDEARGGLSKLLEYFTENKERLLTWRERGVKLPEPPEGIEYRSLGTQEHSNSDIIAHRMKRRKASWSIRGGEHMAKLLCGRATRENVGEPFLKPVRAQSPAAPALSSSRAPRTDGKGDFGKLRQGSWPFDGAYLTDGRKAIKRIFGLKAATDLRIR
jgi:hypothetical protein